MLPGKQKCIWFGDDAAIVIPQTGDFPTGANLIKFDGYGKPSGWSFWADWGSKHPVLVRVAKRLALMELGWIPPKLGPAPIPMEDEPEVEKALPLMREALKQNQGIVAGPYMDELMAVTDEYWQKRGGRP